MDLELPWSPGTQPVMTTDISETIKYDYNLTFPVCVIRAAKLRRILLELGPRGWKNRATNRAPSSALLGMTFLKLAKFEKGQSTCRHAVLREVELLILPILQMLSFSISLDRTKDFSSLILGLFEKYVEETSKLQNHMNHTHEAQVKCLEEFHKAYELGIGK